MATFIHDGSSSKSPEQLTEYFADMRNLSSWDPTVKRVTRLDEGPIARGSRFEVEIDAGSGTQMLTYELTELEPGLRVRARAASSRLLSDDVVEIAQGEGGTSTYRYSARLDGKGLWKLAEPLLAVMLKRIGKNASTGLDRELS
jgi:hypothetical protein